MNKARFVPIAIFAVLVLLMAVPLIRGHDPSVIESALIGKPAPATPVEGIEAAQLSKGTVIVNFFASWCVTCVAEQPLLSRLAAQGVAIYGIAYKDKRDDTQAWLAKHGNPFRAVGRDENGTASIDWGLYGVPETFVLQNGVIRLRHAGTLSEDVLARDILPLLEGAAK
jgi:cytochrome c biogenesis protein CcmG/thiol:disulfide interchange protein DsbE